MLHHLALTRRVFTRLAKSIDEEIADTYPKGLNNTIRWHIGHTLFVAEHYIFDFPTDSTDLPVSYDALFKNGTKPSEWKIEPPSIAELVEEIEKQTERLNKLPKAYFDAPLEKELPFGRFKTNGDLFIFIIHHEAEHIGQIKMMKQLIEAKQYV